MYENVDIYFSNFVSEKKTSPYGLFYVNIPVHRYHGMHITETKTVGVLIVIVQCWALIGMGFAVNASARVISFYNYSPEITGASVV